MKKIYVEHITSASNEETKELFSKLSEAEEKIKQEASDDDYETDIFIYHEYVRRLLDFENKIFVFGEATDKETNEKEVVIFFFDKEPDGKCYKVHEDDNCEGISKYYIEVEED